MTPKFSFIAAAAGAALLIVPAAWGQGSPDAVERAVAARQAQDRTIIVSPDAVDRANAARAALRATPVTMPDVVERAVAARSTTGRTLVFDNHRMTTPVTTRPTLVASGSGRDIEWPQIGVGFAIGILLALGLMFAVRGLRIRPLAH